MFRINSLMDILNNKLKQFLLLLFLKSLTLTTNRILINILINKLETNNIADKDLCLVTQFKDQESLIKG